jgi:hypothetical protein
MLDKKLSAFIRSVAIALIFFSLGRLLVIQLGNTGYWVIGILLGLFYVGWWVLFRRDRGEE